MMELARAIRWHREDIVQATGQDYGNYTFNSGMLQAWQLPFGIGDEILLVAIDGDAAYILSTGRWDAAPTEPTSFARWAFELPTPLDRFYERMEHHDGAIIESLLARDRAHWRTVVPEIYQFGPVLEKPKCSIVIPLYGRFDFILNQMLEFSEDEQIKHGADLIYVIDDPRIASNVIQQAWLLYEANRVSFRLVVANENRGFAGANNLGISVSRAPFLLLLNSDVIPVEPGDLFGHADPYDVGKLSFVSVGYLFGTITGQDGTMFHAGLFLRAYLTCDIPNLTIPIDFGDGPCQCAGFPSDDSSERHGSSIRENEDLGGQGRALRGLSLMDWIGFHTSGAGLAHRLDR